MSIISVIIPCYNVEKYIDRCLTSVVKQTIGITNLEVICVDDASTDHTLDKLWEWESKYSEYITIIPCKINGRQGCARNIGLAHASSEYIAFLDADDWIECEMYEYLYYIAQKYDIELVSSGCGRDSGDGIMESVGEVKGILNQPVWINGDEARREFLKSGLNGGVVSKLFRKDIFKKYDLSFPEKLLYEDNYFIELLFFSIQSFYNCSKIFYHYYINPSSTIMRTNDLENLHDRMKINQLIIMRLEELGYSQKYPKEVADVFLKIVCANTLNMMLLRFDNFPFEEFLLLRKDLLTHYEAAEVKEMESYAELSEINQILIDRILAGDWSKEQWNAFRTTYVEAMEI